MGSYVGFDEDKFLIKRGVRRRKESISEDLTAVRSKFNHSLRLETLFDYHDLLKALRDALLL